MPRCDVRGMIAAFEFMYVTNAIANLIRENKVFRIPSSIQTGKKYGMQLLDDHLFQLWTEGKIDKVEAIDRSQSRGDSGQDRGLESGRPLRRRRQARCRNKKRLKSNSQWRPKPWPDRAYNVKELKGAGPGAGAR